VATYQKKLYDFCLNILAHSELDMEVTLCGNGINSSEAYAVAKALMHEFKITIAEDDIKEAVSRLKNIYGEE